MSRPKHVSAKAPPKPQAQAQAKPDELLDHLIALADQLRDVAAILRASGIDIPEHVGTLGSEGRSNGGHGEDED